MWSLIRMVCVRLFTCCECVAVVVGVSSKCGARCGEPAQMDVSHIRIFLLPACDSYTRQSSGATEDLGS